MSENLELRFTTACAAVKLVEEAGVLDLLPDEFEFLITPKVWIATDRAQARRVVESSVYGTLDYLGLPRFDVPGEFIAACIAYYVSPVNTLFACSVFDGCEWTENIINGISRPVRAAEIFALVLRIRRGETSRVEDKLKEVKKRLKGA